MVWEFLFIPLKKKRTEKNYCKVMQASKKKIK